MMRVCTIVAGIVSVLALCCLGLMACAIPEDRDVELVYVEWSDAVATTNVARVVLEEMGHEVDMLSVTAAAMWHATAEGDVEGFLCGWLPVTHRTHHEALADKLDDLGPNMRGARLGLAVPTYMDIDSIAELPDVYDALDGEIIGIDPGAGLMESTEKAMADYGLDEFTLMEGSGATMTAALAGAYAARRPIVVTAWTPHWMFAKWDLKYLDDPKGSLGGAETVHTIVRKGLAKDMPDVHAFLDAFAWEDSDLEELMVWIRENRHGTTPYENARHWVQTHPEVVSTWTSGRL